MFSGIIEELGTIRELVPHQVGVRLTVEASEVTQDLEVGDSIAVNGCCLTVTERREGSWSADVVNETMQRTNLGELKAGDQVNLEAALRLNQRIGGHLVQGHIDGTGEIQSKQQLADGSMIVTISAPESVLKYVIEKGSIAVDGVSLTVFSVTSQQFSFAMIPHTARVTILGKKPVASTINLEVDMMAKYAEKLVGGNG